MKYLVTVLSIVSAASASPIGPDYENPLAPVETVVPIEGISIPISGPPVIEPTLRALPFARSALPLAARPIIAPSASPVHQPLPLARAIPAPFAQPLQFARAIPAPIAQTLPAPVAHPVPFRALPDPVSIPQPIAGTRALPVHVPVPAAIPSSQFQAQDESGGFSFGYQNVNSAKEEVRTPDGVTKGAYSYVDANGIVQRVEYIADPINGFRVFGSNLPIAVSAPIADTPEVAAAKAEFQLAFDAAVVRNAIVESERTVPVRATLQLRK